MVLIINHWRVIDTNNSTLVFATVRIVIIQGAIKLQKNVSMVVLVVVDISVSYY